MKLKHDFLFLISCYIDRIKICRIIIPKQNNICIGKSDLPIYIQSIISEEFLFTFQKFSPDTFIINIAN
jgi:hypothetical protein